MKKCGRCAKPAVLHITELQHGEVKGLLHLCESCAKEYLNHGPGAAPDAELAESEAEETEEPLDDLDQHVCPSCGISFKEFRSQGRLGCPNDYIAFQDELLPLLENIHGETQHAGKVPKRAPHASQKQYQLIRLRNQLRAAVEDEMYEEAARLRDQIAVIETEMAAGQPTADA
jgi:protein arginine kinase activator